MLSKLALAKGALSVALMSISFKVFENSEPATLRNSLGNESLFWLVMSTYCSSARPGFHFMRCNSADTLPFGFS